MLQTILAPHYSTGLLILRLALGITFFVHGWAKIKNVSNVAGFFKMLKIPLAPVAAWVVTLLETVGAALLIVGLATKILALGFAIDMVVAIVVARIGAGHAKFSGGEGGGWELEFLLLAGALALLAGGAGILSIDRFIGM